MIDALGERMKRYELASKGYLTRKTPVIVRVDGKAFHTLTQSFEKPFDKVLLKVMALTMRDLCREVQGCVFGYTQSDEITLVLTDYATKDTGAYFDYNIQKLTSVIASLATRSFIVNMSEVLHESLKSKDREFYEKYLNSCKKVAFDARCFNIPKEEVCNNLIWRQNDAVRNAILNVGFSKFSKKELFKKSCKDVLNMLKGIGVDFENDFFICERRGACCYRKEYLDEEKRAEWFIDYVPPLFKECREYVEKHI